MSTARERQYGAGQTTNLNAITHSQLGTLELVAHTISSINDLTRCDSICHRQRYIINPLDVHRTHGPCPSCLLPPPPAPCVGGRLGVVSDRYFAHSSRCIAALEDIQDGRRTSTTSSGITLSVLFALSHPSISRPLRLPLLPLLTPPTVPMSAASKCRQMPMTRRP